MDNNVENENVFDEFLLQDAQAQESYIQNIYSKKVPPPEKPTKEELSFWNIAGIEAVLFTVAAIGVVIFSSIRTGGLFFILEQLLLKEFGLSQIITDGFSLMSMIFSLLAFEGYVTADGFFKGKNNGSVKTSKIGVFSSLAVIVIAGIFTGIGLVELPESIKTGFYITIAIVTAIAGGIVAYFSGENIGFTFSKVQRDRIAIQERHREAYDRWLNDAVSSYQKSHYNIRHKSAEKIYGNKPQFFKNNSKNENLVDEEYENFKKQKEQDEKNLKFQNWYNSLSKREKVYYHVEDFFNKNGKLPTVQEISNLGFSIGYASEGINKFIVQNEELLLSNNIIGFEKVTKAKESLKISLDEDSGQKKQTPEDDGSGW